LIALKFLQEFVEAVFSGAVHESLLDDEEVQWARPEKRVKNGHNFWYNRWIALKCLHEFLEAVFLRVALDSLLVDEDVWSSSPE
jgi:hypothetical protein